MRQIHLVILLCCFAFLDPSSSAHGQKILMKIGGITVAAGEELRALEMKNFVQTNTGAGGSTGGTAVAGELVVKKSYDRSTTLLLDKMVRKDSIATLTIEYYDPANFHYYTLELSDVRVIKLYYLSPECPQCVQLEHEIGFSAVSILFDDRKNKLKRTWNTATNTIN